MPRYGRTVAIIVVLITIAGLILGFQKISIANFERGADTPLGLSLGLDLQGGIHLVYQADMTDPDTGERSEVTSDQMEALRRTIERRVNSSGLGEPIIQLLGNDRLLIQLPGITDRDRAVSIIGETARLEFKRRSSQVPRDVTEITAEDILSVSVDVLPNEPDPAETPVPAETPEADQTPTPAEPEDPAPLKLLIEFSDSGVENMQAIFDNLNLSYMMTLASLQAQDPQLRPPSILEILIQGEQQQRFQVNALSVKRVDDNTFAFDIPLEPDTQEQPSADVARERVGNDPELTFVEIQAIVDEDVGLSGDDLSRAFPGQHSASQRPIVNLEFNDRGTRLWGELTTDIVAKAERTGQRDQIAIFLDDTELISPFVQSPITAGTAIIEGGDFTIERVRDIALNLEAGRLPIPITLIQERDVDAILGADSLAKSVVAGFVGLGLVLLFMTLYYRLPGLVASIALLIYAALVLTIFKILPVTLTLSGVAAVILSIGMAVDANILIFERMKDELRAGRTLLSSINIGFDRAWPAIRDGNVSTLITCAILFWFADQLGASIVQGFAVTLAIGVVTSMFTAIIVSRTLLRFIATVHLTRKNRLWLPSGGSELSQPIA